MAYKKIDGVDYVEDMPANVSPNRMDGSAILSAIEVISDYIGRIPYMNVNFEGNQFVLSFNRNSMPSDVMFLRQTVEAELDQIVGDIHGKLKLAGFSPKIEVINIDINGIAQNTWRNVIYSIKGIYSLEI